MPQVPTTSPPKQTVVIIGTRDIEDAVIRRQLDAAVEILACEPDADKAIAVIHEKRPGLVLLFMDHDREGVLNIARKVAAAQISAIMISRDRDPDTILLAMRSGARDFAYLEGEENDILRAVIALSTTTPQAQPRRGTVVAVFSCKGGSGATTIATNIAGALLEDEQRRVALLDLDAQLGDALTFLDLPSRYTWSELLRNLHRLDDELVHRSLTAHSSGLRVVAQGSEVDESDSIDARAVTQTIDFLRQHYDFVIIDGIRDFSENALAALDAADRVAVVLTQDVPALKNAARCLTLFHRLGYRSDKLKLFVNRYHKRDKLDLDTMADALGVPIDATISNDFAAVIRSINEGVLLVKSAPHASVTEDIRALLPALELLPRMPKRGWFRRHR